ncbi:MAG: thioredoxin-disulfide reductase [Polyangiaceae bacterium]|jgi:thioredoxin reductase (NADPH)|nr:thioredoxin-disulfide reductase [Polyangiaceae bacterium]MCK6533740.1 thioredoxin-disulfide reductase [Polyangiaceae bacterium]
MSEPRLHNVLIIGSGPAGLTASIYAARANLKPFCVEGFNAGGLIPGGQLMFTTDVENYPGFPEGVTGQEMMAKFREQAERQGTEIVTADVQKVDFSSRPFKIWVGEDENELHLAKTVIIATGARANYVGLPNEEKLKNKGVSACAVCDGALYRNQAVAVVGGGDTAMEEASYLAGLCSKVTLIHRRDEFRASKAMQQRVTANPKIEILYSHVVDDVLDVSADKVTAVRVKSVKTGEVRSIEIGALFVAIGHTPMTELFKGQLELQPNGYLKVEPGSTRTNVSGVFAAGDVADWTYRQAVTAAGTGCMAALDAERWLQANDH